MQLPTFQKEQSLWAKGFKYIAGVDEVGRGCFAGPVVAAAVILPSSFSQTKRIRDSKLLPAKIREELAEVIMHEANAYAIAEISVNVINKIGIGKATQQAFRQSVKKLSIKPDFVLIDAFYIKHMKRNSQEPIVHGDALCMSIAAASIIAKVYRDAIMRKIHSSYEAYDFATNKGYGTKKHQEAIRKFGLTPLHRTSFDLRKFVDGWEESPLIN